MTRPAPSLVRLMESSSCSVAASNISSQESVPSGHKTVHKNSKKARENTLEEKRRMRNNRKKKHRCRQPSDSSSARDLRRALETERNKNELYVRKLGMYQGMSRTYWERWKWELQKRKEAMIQQKKNERHGPSKQLTSVCTLQEIDPSMLVDVDLQSTSESNSAFVGRGCFGIVKVQKYRGILVAVKEYLSRTLSEDVMHEARILARLCHPYVPCLLGVSVSLKPMRLVMQFEGIVVDGVPKALTLDHLLGSTVQQIDPSPISSILEWISACIQIMEALLYLHENAGILHNDIKSDNILVTKTPTCSDCHIVLVDFGKATTLSEAKKYYLSIKDQAEYTRRYLHIAPELISGESQQSMSSDMFSVGGILYKLVDAKKFDSNKHVYTAIEALAGRCRVVNNYRKRPRAREALSYLQELTVS